MIEPAEISPNMFFLLLCMEAAAAAIELEEEDLKVAILLLGLRAERFQVRYRLVQASQLIRTYLSLIPFVGIVIIQT